MSPIHSEASSKTGLQEEKENAWLSWFPNSNLLPKMLYGDTGEVIGVGQVTLTLASWSSELLPHEKYSVCTPNPVPGFKGVPGYPCLLRRP